MTDIFRRPLEVIMRNAAPRAMPAASLDGTSEELGQLEKRWKAKISEFKTTGNAKCLQTAGDALYNAIKKTHGELAAVVAFQAGGWPRPWERSFSFPPAYGDTSRHDAILFEMLKDIGEGIGQWENLPRRNVLTLLDHILIRRNRRASPFKEFGKAPDSGEWPYDDCKHG